MEKENMAPSEPKEVTGVCPECGQPIPEENAAKLLLLQLHSDPDLKQVVNFHNVAVVHRCPTYSVVEVEHIDVEYSPTDVILDMVSFYRYCQTTWAYEKISVEDLLSELFWLIADNIKPNYLKITSSDTRETSSVFSTIERDFEENPYQK